MLLSSDQRSEDSQSEEEVETCQTQSPQPIFCLNPTLEDRATSYFVYSHAIGITIPGYDEHNDMTMAHLTNIMDPILADSMKAASLASYAHHVRSSKLADISRYHYTNALRLTNKALGSPVHATKDSTLLSVILLGLYEMLTGRNQRSFKDWADHAQGAAALLKLRGSGQFLTTIGRRMFLQASGSVLGSCLQRCMRLPDHMMDMMGDLAELMGGFGEDAILGVRIFQVMLGLNEFRCDVRDGTITGFEAVTSRARQLDQPLAALCNDYPSDWRYETFSAQDLDPDVVFNGRYHVYAELGAAAVWNSIRMFRMFIHQELREYFLKGSAAEPLLFSQPEFTSQFNCSTDICYEMQAAVFASVPQSLGYIRVTGICDEGLKSIPTLSADGTRMTHMISSAPTALPSSGNVLLWPLMYAGVIDLATKEMRTYSAKHLREIGDKMGLQQAIVLAEVVETRVEPEDWGQNTR